MFTGMTRRRLGGAATALAVVVLAALVAAGAARAGGASVYTDAAGDNATAPDIQQVTLTDGGNGTVGVEIDLAAVIPDDGSAVVVLIDADRNPQTGDSGAEYAFCAGAQGASLMKWDGADWSSFDHQPLAADLVGGQLTFTLTLSDLATTGFDFVVGGMHGDDLDTAPENGAFTYPQAPAKPTIRGFMVTLSALVPKAGKTLRVAPEVHVRLSTDEIVVPDSLVCTLTQKGKQLQPVGNCTWKLPTTVKGKHLTLKLTATYQGETGTITLPVQPG